VDRPGLSKAGREQGDEDGMEEPFHDSKIRRLGNSYAKPRLMTRQNQALAVFQYYDPGDFMENPLFT
jgi:hypothetical protein